MKFCGEIVNMKLAVTGLVNYIASLMYEIGKIYRFRHLIKHYNFVLVFTSKSKNNKSVKC